MARFGLVVLSMVVVVVVAAAEASPTERHHHERHRHRGQVGQQQQQQPDDAVRVRSSTAVHPQPTASDNGRQADQQHASVLPAKRKNKNKNKNKNKKHNKSKEARSSHQRGLKEFDYASDMTDDSSVPASVPAMKRKQQQQQRHAGEMQRQSNDKAIKHRRTSAKNKPAKRNGNKSGHEYKDHDSSVQLLGLGVFGDMQKFFDELRTDLDDEKNRYHLQQRREQWLRQAAAAAAAAAAAPASPQGSSDAADIVDALGEEEEFPNYQALKMAASPPSSLASPSEGEQRRQSRLRGFVSMTEPVHAKNRHHQYDPGLLYTGIGR